MARAPKKTPGLGHNGGLPDHGDIRTAAAMEMIYEDKEKALREEKKRARLRLVEGKGLLQDDMKFLKGLREKSATEVIDIFKRQWHSVGAFYPEAHEQMDLFTKKSDAPTRAAHFTMGLLAGLQGKELVIPPMIVGDDQQQMIAGHNEGRERHAAAQAGILGQALENAANGKVTDGKTGAPILDKTAADFSKDQAASGGDDPLVVNGEKYPTVRQANAARKRLEQQGGGAPADQQDSGRINAPFWDAWHNDNTLWDDEKKDTFCKWFDAQPEGDAPIVIEHPGAQAEFKRLRDASKPEEPAAPEPPVTAPKRVVPRPDFHAWDEDWLKWTGPQAMEFRRWFESHEPGYVPAITHEGAVAFWRELVAEVENRASGGDDDEKWDAAAPQRQAADLPNQEEVDAAAAKLAGSGFVPPKTGGRKPLAKA